MGLVSFSEGCGCLLRKDGDCPSLHIPHAHGLLTLEILMKYFQQELLEQIEMDKKTMK